MTRLSQSPFDEDDADSVLGQGSQRNDTLSVQPNSARQVNRSKAPGQSSFTLTTLFQIVTGCCVFFAVLQASPLFAILGTIILTPAIVRTAIASDVYLQKGIRFTVYQRFRYFFESTGLTVVSLFFSAAAFSIISLCFGIFSAIFAVLMGLPSMAQDIAFVGTVCGMIWGGTAGLIVFGWCIRNWYTVAAIEAYEEKLSNPETVN